MPRSLAIAGLLMLPLVGAKLAAAQIPDTTGSVRSRHRCCMKSQTSRLK